MIITFEYRTLCKIIFFLKFLLSPVLLKTNGTIITNIIKIENTNGDIYFSQTDPYLILGTVSSNGKERIFYGNSEDNSANNEGNFLENNGTKVQYLNKEIKKFENKDLSNPEVIFLSYSSYNFFFLIGSGNSYIELQFLNLDMEDKLPIDFQVVIIL